MFERNDESGKLQIVQHAMVRSANLIKFILNEDNLYEDNSRPKRYN